MASSASRHNDMVIGASAIEILDSRGHPTLRVFVELADGSIGRASVPAGASTGRNEAVEIRDNAACVDEHERRRYGGKGVLQAVRTVSDEIEPRIVGMRARHQVRIDQALMELDGTGNKGRLGANAILGVSMAVAQAAATSADTPLYAHLGGVAARRLPVPMMNVINGGQHADNNLDMQEYMIVPHGAATFSEALRYGSETFHALKSILKAKGHSTAVGDEGGFAPALDGTEEACALIVEAISKAGLRPGPDVAIALDPAASSFARDGRYELSRSGAGSKTSAELIALYREWIDQFPILSIEDGLAEDDWDGFSEQTRQMGKDIQIVGDDLYVTNPEIIDEGIRRSATNAVLIKPNQIGTVTETIAAVEHTRAAGWAFIVSHRSGETEDSFISDFAVAMGGGQIKTGSLCRGERIAKYNRLLEIEHELGTAALFDSPFPRFR